MAPQRAPTPASHPTPHPSPLKCAQCAAKYDMSPKVTGSCKASNIDDMQAEKNACSGSNPIPKNANYSLGSWGPSYGVKTCADVSNVMELTAGTGSAAISYLKCFGNPSDPSLGEKYCMDSWSKFFSSAAYDTLIAGRSFSGAQLGECCIRVAFISKKERGPPPNPTPPSPYLRTQLSILAPPDARRSARSGHSRPHGTMEVLAGAQPPTLRRLRTAMLPGWAP